MRPVTIDNLKIEDHVRWANDQTLLDPVYTKDPSLIAHHPELLWISSLHTSKWDELFDWQNKNIPFANFEIPYQYHQVSKRLFTHLICPNISWEEEEENEKEEEEEEKEDASHHGPDLLKQILLHQAPTTSSTSLFEQEKSIIIQLLEAIKELNKLLGQINARKLQYQKG